MTLPQLIAVALAMLLVGCSSHQAPVSVAGTWAFNDPSSPGNDSTYIFKSDGTYTFAEHVSYQSIQSHQSASGTYTISGTDLTLDTLQESMGIDASTMAAIDAREKTLNPNIHIMQDKNDIPVKIEQPISVYTFSVSGDQLILKDKSNAADFGRTYTQM
jgi:DUF4097 and DUF4098 domain-containing protein YvlB